MLPLVEMLQVARMIARSWRRARPCCRHLWVASRRPSCRSSCRRARARALSLLGVVGAPVTLVGSAELGRQTDHGTTAVVLLFPVRVDQLAGQQRKRTMVPTAKTKAKAAPGRLKTVLRQPMSSWCRRPARRLSFQLVLRLHRSRFPASEASSARQKKNHEVGFGAMWCDLFFPHCPTNWRHPCKTAPLPCASGYSQLLRQLCVVVGCQSLAADSPTADRRQLLSSSS